MIILVVRPWLETERAGHLQSWLPLQYLSTVTGHPDYSEFWQIVKDSKHIQYFEDCVQIF